MLRRSIRILAVLVFLPVLAGSVAAGSRSIPLADETTALRLVESQPNGDLLYEVNIGELVALDVTTPEGVFTQLLIPGFHHALAVGEPALPMMNRLIEIPFAATAEVEIQSFDRETLRLEDLGVEHPLLPAQPSVSKSADPSTLPFHVNRATYAGGEYALPLAKVVDTGRMRAVRIGRLEIAPVSYDPSAGTITVKNHIRLAVHFPGADYERDAAEKARTQSPFFEGVYQRIDRTTAHETHPDLMQGPVKYVIVSDRMFEAALQPFIAWKTKQGFEVVQAYTDEIGATTASISTYLQNLYDSGSAVSPAPTFVLFVGDVNLVPTFSLSGATDLPYCDLTGDYAPEMFYGRFSARNLGELSPQIDKTLLYERYEMSDPSYLGDVCMIAGVDPSYGPTYANGQINYGTNLYFNAAHGILSHTYLYPASGSSASQIHQDVSNGVAFANYTAHGSETAWSNPSFTINDINNLQNDQKYCLAVGNCCLTSSFNYGDCFAEHWLRVANKGAIGYIGGSNYTYWDEDYWWGVGYGPIVGSGPTYEQTGLGSYDGLFHDHDESMDQWYVVQDAIVFCGNLAVQEAASSLISYYWQIYNLMGDPSLSPYLGLPVANSVSHDAEIGPPSPFGVTAFHVSAEPNSYVGVTLGDQLLGCGMVGASGTATIVIRGAPAQGTAQVVITCQNRIPYFDEVQIGQPADAPETGGPDGAIAGVAPNPFSPRTTVSFTLASAERVSLAIYDLEGRQVRRLVDSLLPSGNHRYDWDGRDDGGRAVAGGVYLARLQTPGREKSWKMVLAR